jgi:hypothetical protein
MIKKHKEMNKITVIILFLGFTFRVTGQTLLFETKTLQTSPNLVLEKAENSGITVGFKTLNSVSNNPLKFTGASSHITTYKLTNPGKIQISHLIPRKGDDLVLSIYYSTDKKGWKKIPKLDAGIIFNTEVNTDTLVTSKTYYIDFVGECYIKFEVEQYISGSFQIEGISIYEIDIKTLELMKQKEKLIQDLIAQKEQIKTELSYDETVDNAKKLKERYLKQIDNYELLLNKTGNIEILYSLTIFMYKRAKMVSPNEYSDFESILKDLRTKADTLDRVMLSQLNESLKAPEEPTNKSSNAAAIIRLGYNLGNIVSGGKLESIVSSFKGIFARTYSTTNLIIDEMQRNPDKSMFVEVRKSDGYVKLKREELQMVRATSLSGVEKFNKLSNFFLIIQNEHNHLEELVNKLESSNLSLEQFRILLTDDIKHTFKAVNYDITDRSINLLQIADNNTVSTLRHEVERYFNEVIFTDRSEFPKNRDYFQPILETANLRLQKFEEVKNKYFGQVESLSNISQEFIDDMNRENPFKNYQKDFANSFAKWDEMKKDAQNKINHVPSDITDLYLKYVQNKM